MPEARGCDRAEAGRKAPKMEAGWGECRLTKRGVLCRDGEATLGRDRLCRNWFEKEGPRAAA